MGLSPGIGGRVSSELTNKFVTFLRKSMIGASSGELVNSIVLNKFDDDDDDDDGDDLRTSGENVTKILKLFALKRRTVYWH